MREMPFANQSVLVCSSGAVIYASYNISLEKSRARSTISIKFLLNFYGTFYLIVGDIIFFSCVNDSYIEVVPTRKTLFILISRQPLMRLSLVAEKIKIKIVPFLIDQNFPHFTRFTFINRNCLTPL